MLRVRLSALAALLAGLALVCAAPAAPADDPPGRLLGTFRLTHYFVAQEQHAGRGRWPLFSPACERILAHTSETFHHELSLEGTGRLRDGRLLNFSERCPCARPGFQGSRICYDVLDTGLFPWGRGAPFDGGHAALEPFRSVAVDPRLVPLGTVLYVPEFHGRRWPDGRFSDGCVRAEDIGRLIRNRHLDLFTGRPEWSEALFRKGMPSRVRVYVDNPACRKHAREPVPD